MLIGLDAIPLTEPKTGVGHYTFELARALARTSPRDEFKLIYPSRYAPVQLAAGDEPLPPPNLHAERIRAGLLGRRWWSVGLPRHVRRRRIELFHGTNFDVPLGATCPTVLTVHDLSAFLHPSTHVARRARRLRRRLPLMARAATMIVTPTERVRREMCELLGIEPEKIVAVAEAPREVFRPAARDETEASLRRLDVEGDFLLAVGTVEPRKNLLTLLRAFEEVLRADGGADTGSASTEAYAARRQLTLVVAGREGWLSEELFAQLARSPACESVRFTGYVSDEELRALYSSCVAFVYPSVYEGFGLPPLEAMACGAPVVASRTGAHVEVLGEESALLFPPEDAGALARALSRLIRDEGARRSLAAGGRAHAARFTWESAARETRAVYDEALKRWAATGMRRAER